MALRSVLDDRHWISLVQPFLWANEELRISTLSSSFLAVHSIARNEILSGISLWIRICWEEWNDRRQLDATAYYLWRRELRDAASEYSGSESSEWWD